MHLSLEDHQYLCIVYTLQIKHYENTYFTYFSLRVLRRTLKLKINKLRNIWKFARMYMHKINTKLRIPLILSPRVFNSSWIIISTHQKRINKHICLHIFFTFITWKEKEEVTCSFSYLPSHNSHGFGITYLVLLLFMSKQLFNDEYTNHYANATGKLSNCCIVHWYVW